MSSNTPWHTDRWFTSPWNHDPEMGDLQFPAEIEIHDVTLRDGEQQAGVEFRADDKIRIAEALAEAGVQRIEAGLPAVSDEDEKAVREIASRNLGAKIYAFSRCMVDDVKKAIDCGVHGVVMEIPSSKHLIELGYRWSLERAIDLSIEATSFAHEAGLQVSFFPIDATRASVTDYLNLVSRVAEDGHVDALGLVDTFGVLTPHAVERFVKVSRERLNVPLETHFHQDFGLGVANSLIAAAAGAACLQTTVGGLGERAGNTPTEETVLALLTLYNQDIGIKTEKLTSVSRLVMELAGVSQPGNRPITGETLFNVESGIIATWVRNVRDVDTTEVVPYLPSLVGQPGPTIVLGKGSGIDNIAEGLERLGVEATDEQKMEMLMQVKSKSLQKRDLLDDEEFAAIAEDVLGTRA
ncbi:MAG: pyruvate carboxyltransferase [Nitriliruptorales bacterium]|nr:pyruvate carboxyltransferase [Nitriliruptorales bacterium]